MPDPLASQIPSPLQLRARLKDIVRRDLLGPAGGPEEEVDERAVRGRYILGLLAPRGQTILPDDQDDLPAAGADTEQDGKADPAALQTASMLPSAIRLSFNVDLGAEAIAVTARWGRYTRTDSETLTDDKGDPRRVWRREQIAATSRSGAGVGHTQSNLGAHGHESRTHVENLASGDVQVSQMTRTARCRESEGLG